MKFLHEALGKEVRAMVGGLRGHSLSIALNTLVTRFSQVVEHNSLWSEEMAIRGTVIPKVTTESSTKAGCTNLTPDSLASGLWLSCVCLS